METNFKKCKEFLLDVLYPKFCANCQKEGSYLCEDCFYLLDIFENIYCPFCKKPDISEGSCDSCRKSHNLDGLYSAVSYQDKIIRRMVADFKYGFVRDLSKTLSYLIAMHLAKINKLNYFSDFAIIPVPLYKKKIRFRGYNQSQILAKELAAILKAPLETGALLRIKNTLSQAELKKEDREENVKNAFTITNPKIVKGKKILLVDDVFTTGYTMEEAARILKQAGAKKVFGLTIARGE